jgi:hypothetical protein
LDGKAPWILTAFPSVRDIKSWLMKFPDHAMKEVSFGDLSIIQDWNTRCQRNPRRRVLIRSLDHHLAAYNRKL